MAAVVLRRFGSGLFALMLSVFSTRAAEARGCALSVVREVGAESCIWSQRLARLVEQAIGPAFVAASDAELSIEARLRRSADGRAWEARVVMGNGRGELLGERELRSTAADCHALDRQLVLVIAVAIDPDAALRPLPDELSQVFPGDEDAAAALLRQLRAERPKAPVVEVELAEEPIAAEVSFAPSTQLRGAVPAGRSAALSAPGEKSWKIALGAALAVANGSLPRVAAGAGFAFDITPPAFWRLVLSGVWWFENDAALKRATARGAAIHFRMLHVAAGLCPSLLHSRRVQLHACAGLFAALRATDSNALEVGIDVHQTGVGPWVGLQAGYAVASPLWLSIAFSAHAQLNREVFTYRDELGHSQQLFSPPLFAPMVQIGMRVQL